MKKKLPIKDILIIVILFAAMLAWGPLYQKFLARPAGPAPQGKVDSGSNAAPETVVATSAPVAPESVPPVQTVPAENPATPVLQQPSAVRAPEETRILSNGWVQLTISSRGGGIVAAELPGYALTKKDPRPVVLDFRKVPALVYEGWKELDGVDFAITLLSDGAAARLDAVGADGVRIERFISLGERYEVTVEDRLINASDAARQVPGMALTLGSMEMLEGESAMKGMQFLGIDTLPSTGGEGVRHWSSKRFFSGDLTLADYFQEEAIRGHGCVGRPKMTRMLPPEIRERINRDTDWMAVKNKFFVQILAPKDGAVGCDLIADRVIAPGENPADARTWQSAAAPRSVAGALRFSEQTLKPGESMTRSMQYYVGPKELSSIKPMGRHMKEVMEFGMLKWVCEILVMGLRGLYGLIPNYGIAIILLTLLVRIIFWPLTHKGTESMKRMQELQPKMKELQEKYRDKPQKLQQEMMALYREHKINPMGGCLPMLIQIPVFFALFNVLRSAIELRFAGFLWVGDLSEAENLFAGVLPLPLNLLPLIMAATQAWQQKLTPSTGDPAQQKMMMFMPVIMLLFLYSMPSGLVLYWTANQVMMIVQLLWQQRAKRNK